MVLCYVVLCCVVLCLGSSWFTLCCFVLHGVDLGLRRFGLVVLFRYVPYCVVLADQIL